VEYLSVGPAYTAVRILACTVPLDFEATFRAVRHGKGTPALQAYARKPYVVLGDGE